MILSVNSCGSTVAEVSGSSPSTAGRYSGKVGAVCQGLGNVGSNNPCALLHHSIRIVTVNLLEGRKWNRETLQSCCPCLGDSKVTPGSD